MAKTLSKSQVWAEVQNIIAEYGINEEGSSALGELFKPKSRSQVESRTIENEDGETLFYCRYTNHFWPSTEMVYQNDEKRDDLKDKGYSKVGISLWSKGAKHSDKLNREALELMKAGEMEEAQIKGTEALEFDRNRYQDLEALLTDDQIKMMEQVTIEA